MAVVRLQPDDISEKSGLSLTASVLQAYLAAISRNFYHSAPALRVRAFPQKVHSCCPTRTSLFDKSPSCSATRLPAGTLSTRTIPTTACLATVCQQHQFNFLLWHEEDIARSPDVPDDRIAAVKRSIDRYNQQRNDWIEKIDEALIELLAAEGMLPRAGARLNTETPGSAIDRLSIMSLRIYHFEEQLARDGADETHRKPSASGSPAASRSMPICRSRWPSCSTTFGPAANCSKSIAK